jgi:CheY-like chemotaxis protein
LGRETASVSSLKEQMESLAAGREQVERSLAEERTLRTELESQTQAAERRHAAQLTEITARYQALEAECDRLTGALGAHDITHRERAEEVVQLRLNVQSLETRLEETESERDALHEQLANVVALKDRLDRECEQLRRRVASAADLERQRAETSRLQTKLEEAERQHAEAVQRHSAAVSGYMLELNQRTDLLRQREIEQQRLHEQLTLLQQTCDDATTQVAALREEKELLELRVKELESARTVRPRLDRPAASPTAQPAVSAGAAASMTARPQAEAARSGAKRPAADRSHLPVVVLHLEENQSLRDVVRSAAQTSGVKYLTFDEAAAAGDAARPVLAANLLTRTGDPLATIAHVEKWGGEEPRALAYCADGTRGFIVGLVDFFPLPFDPDSCTARLLQVTGSLQRLLAVSDDVEAMSGLREVLSRFRCSTSMAFDGRQALDLIPMVKPDVVLVDLALPKGDALRVIGRLRCDPKMPKPPVALLWGKPVDASEFRHQLLRVIREFQFSTGELTETVREALGRLASEKSSVSGAREAG